MARILMGFGRAMLFVELIVLTACSPEITIVHRDHTNRRVKVIVDDSRTKTVDYGDEVSFNVSRGEHTLKAVTESSSSSSPWSESGQPWMIWVDKGAVLTLLPPTAETQSPKLPDNAATKDAILE